MAERCQPLSPIIALDGVTKCFAAKRALDRVTVTIQPGEFVAVIGQVGGGENYPAALPGVLDDRQ